MQVGNFCLHARKFRLAGLFVNRNNIHKKAVHCETSRPVFIAENYKTTKLHLKNQGMRHQRMRLTERQKIYSLHLNPERSSLSNFRFQDIDFSVMVFLYDALGK